ncbi:MAG: L-threonine 3-dehydrogenase [Armatimonadetes bacterium CG2_30_59_28]|nr:L-threonine 3-dehydrogenase [Armatimonadota bacterium]OIO97794.1 MAG: L-threonine 3-dehydrogenase [Armatimonadetes bacterium CG2_30_59_28]PIU64874.1 MAG: L-threonine 3-dehydrogenase [Armatimonadetes bacterium CG07_land_8_20_14_0_80_59_28]PIX39157.1 MAG: L-threonine 3-dehydrogenase [Armatimonadetes bacterium CG_4_8_14_3_um_filter_58_9]PIY47838.1 MAG: L-threonine 3-dehydrogenase [Armatimonadetes bacterium CG_4_10_14_3_um_filter_59_10]PJB68459.1 MAG: L-threonine 3-dehydrogenase [Armatimonadete
MPERMKVIRKLEARKGLEVTEIPIPTVSRDEVLIKVEAASICGTDLHIFHWDEWSQHRIRPPLTIGHEFCGTVAEVGDEVHNIVVGQFVSAESHVTCGMCFQCRTGQAHLCPRTKILGVDREGCFAEYVSVPEKVVWLNDRRKLTPRIATLQEPFGNAVFATTAHDLAGQSVAILGCGPIGCFSIGIVKSSGAAGVFASDIIDFRLDLAQQMGATGLVNAGRDNAVRKIIELNDGYPVDIVLEMSGAPAAVRDAFSMVRNGGTVTLFGIPAKPVEIDVAEKMIFKNVTVLAMNGRRIFETWYRTRWLLESGVVDLDPLVTHVLDMEQIEDAMNLIDAGKACKIVLIPHGADAASGKTDAASVTEHPIEIERPLHP